jgi:hypothetical protein
VKIHAVLVPAGVLLGASYAFAEPLQPSFNGVLPPAKISGIVHSMGLMPVGQPIRNGLVYAVLAIGQQGKSVRVIVDARSGRVLSVQRVIAAIPSSGHPVLPNPLMPPGRIRYTPGEI